jgi:hypothetical protein
MDSSQTNAVLTGQEGGEFDLDMAASWTKNYRDKHPGETLSQFFGKDILQAILAQENCLGIRFYYAFDKPLNGWQRFTVAISNFILKVIGNIEGGKHLIITGAISTGLDLLPEPKSAAPVGQPMEKVELMGVTTGSKKYLLGQISSPCPGSPGCPQNMLTSERVAK